jgi:hypothetical protein
MQIEQEDDSHGISSNPKFLVAPHPPIDLNISFVSQQQNDFWEIEYGLCEQLCATPALFLVLKYHVSINHGETATGG